MKYAKRLLGIAILCSSIAMAQNDLYLSPAATKTADNSLIITQDGKVGIGKANPQQALEVNGQIHARSVKVDLEGWADFVFEPDYELPSLEQIQAHIQKHGHLEGIPSTQQVLKQGIDLGEISTLLLQKVEELTLHLIQKDKEVKSLEARLAKLEQAIQTQNKSN